ncbi:SDR family NAD(P)-dependent oxidoreductase [uncultured Roseibium sp.]|uniref:SDR family NAD(P)-dependent oxidoreductase n=1 Tax=uncultured Roseibium sp. TaxID=1936171 RepID=UPI002625E31F|nr:SDR family NAD(P)-dependent oxidoreductase [uncultured Roseibium sp.]
MFKEAVAEGGLAVVTGAASGVGLAAATRFAEAGLGIILADLPGQKLDAATEDVRKAANPNAAVIAVPTDVSDMEQVEQLAETVFRTGPVAVLMNNAGIGTSSKCWENYDAWTRMMDVNFFGVLRGVQAFTPRMIEAGRPSVIINTGSKQGITTPPGNPGYNATKAAVKVLSEQLAHELREAGAPISVHLFVPGFTYTGMISSFLPEKPAAAWTSEQTVDHFIERMTTGDFYILCPDNDVDSTRDKRRAEWAVGDIIENRPPLSRWHPDYKEAFAEFENTGKT